MEELYEIRKVVTETQLTRMKLAVPPAMLNHKIWITNFRSVVLLLQLLAAEAVDFDGSMRTPIRRGTAWLTDEDATNAMAPNDKGRISFLASPQILLLLWLAALSSLSSFSVNNILLSSTTFGVMIQIVGSIMCCNIYM